MSMFESPITELLFVSRKIGKFKATCTVRETCVDELEITQHPVEQGANITDHAYLKPSTVSINAVFAPLLTPLKEVYQNLLTLQASREPFDITTGKRTYKNMLFKSLSIVNDANTEFILEINADFQQILIVASQTATVPENSKQANSQITGTATETGEKQVQQQRQSHLSSLLGG